MEPEDYEILNYVQTQLNNKVRFVTLEALCTKKVAESLLLYHDAGLTNLSNFIPTPLCTAVYKEVLAKIVNIQYENNIIRDEKAAGFYSRWDELTHEDRLKIFGLLEKGGLKVFDCKFWGSYVNLLTEDAELHRRLAIGSPKLSSFKDCRKLDYMRPDVLLSDHYSLKFMPSLVFLEIIWFPTKDADLQVISCCMPLLQSLTLEVVNGEDIHQDGLKSLTGLKKLKHITLVTNASVNRRSHIKGILPFHIKKILHLMPHLKTVAERLKRSRLKASHHIPQFKEPVELGLEHLVVWPGTQIPSNVSLPNISKITVHNGAPQPVESLVQFERLEHLNCNFLPSTAIAQILTVVGNQLKNLKIANCPDKVDLMMVFQLCPILREIKISPNGVENNLDMSQLRNKFTLLKSFILEILEQRFVCVESRGLLHLLVTSCPDLEELKLNGLLLTKLEIDMINQEMELGTLTTQKLQNVSILNELSDNETGLPYAKFVEKLCVRNCQILKQVNFAWFIPPNCNNKQDLVINLEESINHHNQTGL